MLSAVASTLDLQPAYNCSRCRLFLLVVHTWKVAVNIIGSSKITFFFLKFSYYIVFFILYLALAVKPDQEEPQSTIFFYAADSLKPKLFLIKSDKKKNQKTKTDQQVGRHFGLKMMKMQSNYQKAGPSWPEGSNILCFFRHLFEDTSMLIMFATTSSNFWLQSGRHSLISLAAAQIHPCFLTRSVLKLALVKS